MIKKQDNYRKILPVSNNILKKTRATFAHYTRVLREQGEQVPPEGEFDSTGGQPPASPDVTDNVVAQPDEQVPMTSEGEEKYIADLVDAALYQPSSEDVAALTNLQSVMQMKKFTNAREEILPRVLNIIRPSTESSDIRSSLDKLSQ